MKHTPKRPPAGKTSKTTAFSNRLGQTYIDAVAAEASTDRETAAAALLAVTHGRAALRRQGIAPTGDIIPAALDLIENARREGVLND
ncbi:hypothetical protein [Gryllotalpicola kribbensis]|uniref:hypothetical protein n=1 Tax=Gryllotalpicola kribbensis TaxID=993084 RepID=UPI0031E37EE1